MMEEIERLRVTVRDMWHERQAAPAAATGGMAISDTEIAAEARIDLNTVRAFLIGEDGRGIVVKPEGSGLSVSAVELGYGE